MFSELGRARGCAPFGPDKFTHCSRCRINCSGQVRQFAKYRIGADDPVAAERFAQFEIRALAHIGASEQFSDLLQGTTPHRAFHDGIDCGTMAESQSVIAGELI